MSRLEGLEDNFRLQRLCVSGNSLETLSGSLQSLPFLTDLNVSANRLRDLEVVLGLLSRCNAELRSLDMSGNAVCEETDYRARVVAALPRLALLDKHAVGDEDRALAAA